MGAYARHSGAEVKRDMDSVFALFPRLAERRAQLGGTLSGGEQQMLAMGRALMIRPRVLMLDEPSMGLAPILVETIFDTIKELNQQGTTIILITHSSDIAAHAHRIIQMKDGRIVSDAKNDPISASSASLQ